MPKRWNWCSGRGRTSRITENHIKQLHRDLLVHSEKDVRHRGSYKTASNNIVAFDEDGKEIGIVFETTTPFERPGG